MAAAPQAPTAATSAPPPLLQAVVAELLPTSDFVLVGDSQGYRNFVRVYNAAYDAGHKFFLAPVTYLLVAVAFPLGICGALWTWAAAIFCRAAAIVGRALADEIGYGEYVRMRTLWVARKRQEHAPRVAVMHPSGGLTAPVRSPALMADELQVTPDSRVTAHAVRTFNKLYSAGFFSGACLIMAVSFLLAPFIGIFFAAADVWYAMFRPFQRAEGKIILSIFGVADLVHQETAYLAEEMGIAHPHVAPGGSGSAGAGSGPGGGGGASNATPLVVAPGAQASSGYGAVPMATPAPGAGTSYMVATSGNGGATWSSGGLVSNPVVYVPPTAQVSIVPAATAPGGGYGGGYSEDPSTAGGAGGGYGYQAGGAGGNASGPTFYPVMK